MRELAEFQIIPHLGSKVLQRLKPDEIETWHNTLLKSGARGGDPLSARTVGHAHRLLRRALQRAVKSEVLARNMASVKSPPKVAEHEVVILTADQVVEVTNKLIGHRLHAIVVT